MPKELRLAKVFRRGRTVIVPVDQAVTTGPVEGLERPRTTIGAILSGAPDAVVAHRGLVQQGVLRPERETGVIVHLSVGTDLSGRRFAKVLGGKLEDAVRLGADAVSVHVTMGVPEEREMLRDLGAISGACLDWGMPLLAMMYVHGDDTDEVAVRHSARVAAELGADVVKVPFTGSGESFQTVTESCFVPVVVAGGERSDDLHALLSIVERAMTAGAAGACIGRNVFQSEDPAAVVSALRRVVHDDASAEESADLWQQAVRIPQHA